MNIVTDEFAVLRDALERNVFDRKITVTIRVLIKHYFSLGCVKQEVRERVEAHMAAALPGFRPLQWERKLASMVGGIARQSHILRRVERIVIAGGELRRIAELRDDALERLAFVLLAYAKVRNALNPANDGWVNRSAAQLLREAGIGRSAGPGRHTLVHELYKRGYVKPVRAVDRDDVQVLFLIDATAEAAGADSDPALVLDDFRDVVPYYLRWKGQPYYPCDCCGLLYVRTSNRGKYCLSCRRGKELAWKRDNMRLKRQAIREREASCASAQQTALTETDSALPAE